MITNKLRSLKKSHFLLLCAVLGVFALLSVGPASAQSYDAVQKRLMEAVKSGEISPEQAKIMMAALQKSATGEKAHTKKPAPIKKKPEAAKQKPEVAKKKPEAAKKKPEVAKKKPEVAKKKLEAAKKKSERAKHSKQPPGPDLGAAWAKLTSLVDEGKISKEDAIAKMAALKKQAALKKSPAGKTEAPSKLGPKKKPEGDHEASARKLKAAVAAGKLTPEQAKAKWEALQKQSAGQKKAKVKK